MSQGHLKKFGDSVQDLSTKILQAALALHDKVSTTFRKTAINFHYEFTVRHLANVFQVRTAPVAAAAHCARGRTGHSSAARASAAVLT